MRHLSYGGLLRRARRHADLSQRELAARAKVDRSVISRIEAGRQHPEMYTMERLLAATGYVLQAVSEDGAHVIDSAATWADQDATRDGAFRRFPAHLDVREPTLRRPWWYHLHVGSGVKAPLMTFDLNRFLRDLRREDDQRTACDDDERCKYPRTRSWVHIPGYRPISRYGPSTAFW